MLCISGDAKYYIVIEYTSEVCGEALRSEAVLYCRNAYRRLCQKDRFSVSTFEELYRIMGKSKYRVTITLELEELIEKFDRQLD